MNLGTMLEGSTHTTVQKDQFNSCIVIRGEPRHSALRHIDAHDLRFRERKRPRLGRRELPKVARDTGMWVQRNLEMLGAVSERFRVFGLFPKHPCHARLGPTTQAEGVVIENQSTPVPILDLAVEADSLPHS